jgi:hypothetical protein
VVKCGERVAQAIARVGEQHRVVAERVAEGVEARAVLGPECGEAFAERADEGLFLFRDADDLDRVEEDHRAALVDEQRFERGERREGVQAAYAAASSIAWAIRAGCTTYVFVASASRSL